MGYFGEQIGYLISFFFIPGIATGIGIHLEETSSQPAELISVKKGDVLIRYNR